jgi:hypothetical protein
MLKIKLEKENVLVFERENGEKKPIIFKPEIGTDDWDSNMIRFIIQEGALKTPFSEQYNNIEVNGVVYPNVIDTLSAINKLCSVFKISGGEGGTLPPTSDAANRIFIANNLEQIIATDLTIRYKVNLSNIWDNINSETPTVKVNDLLYDNKRNMYYINQISGGFAFLTKTENITEITKTTFDGIPLSSFNDIYLDYVPNLYAEFGIVNSITITDYSNLSTTAPFVLWFKTGNSKPTISIVDTIEFGGVIPDINGSYELSIINKRCAIKKFD